MYFFTAAPYFMLPFPPEEKPAAGWGGGLWCQTLRGLGPSSASSLTTFSLSFCICKMGTVYMHLARGCWELTQLSGGRRAWQKLGAQEVQDSLSFLPHEEEHGGPTPPVTLETHETTAPDSGLWPFPQVLPSSWAQADSCDARLSLGQESSCMPAGQSPGPRRTGVGSPGRAEHWWAGMVGGLGSGRSGVVGRTQPRGPGQPQVGRGGSKRPPSLIPMTL